MKMFNATCVGKQTSKIPTRVALFITILCSYFIIALSFSDNHHYNSFLCQHSVMEARLLWWTTWFSNVCCSHFLPQHTYTAKNNPKSSGLLPCTHQADIRMRSSLMITPACSNLPTGMKQDDCQDFFHP